LTLLHPLSNQFKVEWLKQKSAILASLRPWVQGSLPPKKKKSNQFKNIQKG
jgi:hypothetical protein